MMVSKESYDQISKILFDSNATLIAVSKRQSLKKIEELYALGQREFGENRVQEWLEKRKQLPSDIKWHLIGQLQRNKVKYVIPHVHMIHSVDRISLLEEINRVAIFQGVRQNILLQVHIAQEKSKTGFTQLELLQLIESKSIYNFQNINYCGLMGMATNTDDSKMIKNEFKQLNSLFCTIQKNIESTHFNTLSMGMSSDYKLALDCGSNMVRIGSLLFGQRAK